MKGLVYFVIAQKGFRDEELLEPMELLNSEGYATKILSAKKGLCKGSMGQDVTSDMAISEASLTEDVKALVVVGGPDSPSLMNIPELGLLLQDAKEKDILIGAICLGPMIVASFDVMSGITATVFPTEDSLAMLKQKKVHYMNEDVIVDEKFVTANGPHAATAFGHNIIDSLQELKL